MKASSSLKLIHQLAAHEAARRQAADIQPVHLLIAVLRVAEFPIKDADRQLSLVADEAAVAEEIKAIRAFLRDRSIDGPRLRIRLKTMVGGGKGTPPGGPHRSRASRQVFDNAADLARKAGQDTVRATHLLEALLTCRSDVIVHVLAKLDPPKPAPETPARPDGPALRGAVDLVGKGSDPVAADERTAARDAEAKAVEELLAGPAPAQCVALVSPSSDATGDVARQLAARLRERAGTDGRWELLDLSNDRPLARLDHDGRDRLMMAVESAAQTPRRILLLPAGDETVQMGDGESWLGELGDLLTRHAASCLFPATPGLYDSILKRHAAWRRICRPVFVQAEPAGDVPWEL